MSQVAAAPVNHLEAARVRRPVPRPVHRHLHGGPVGYGHVGGGGAGGDQRQVLLALFVLSAGVGGVGHLDHILQHGGAESAGDGGGGTQRRGGVDFQQPGRGKMFCV